MSRSRKIMVLLAFLLVGAGLLFKAQIFRFLFHPEGLSTAASEICLTNQAEMGLIAEIAVANGAKSETYLEDGETACSASADPDATGEIKVSVSEGDSPSCVYSAKSGDHVSLTFFYAPDSCRWKN